MAARFRILHTDVNLRLDRIDPVVMQHLYDFLRRKCSSSYIPPDQMDGEDCLQKLIGYE